MSMNILLCVVASTIVTAIINFAKPAYSKWAGKAKDTINVALSFLLWVVASYAVYPRINVELTSGAIVLIGLAIGTGSQIWFEVLEILKNWNAKTKGL